MKNLKNNLYPILIEADEANELCIREGWYISDGKSISLYSDGSPFGSELEALNHIETLALNT